jgi:hypothetical protein
MADRWVGIVLACIFNNSAAPCAVLYCSCLGSATSLDAPLHILSYRHACADHDVSLLCRSELQR